MDNGSFLALFPITVLLYWFIQGRF